MKIAQVSPHIWSVTTWAPLLFPIRVWIVADDSGVTLVDAGLSMMAPGIVRFIARLDRGPLQRLLLTHSHGDHTGAIQAIRSKWPVPVYVHRVEIPYAEGKLPHPGRKKAQASIAKGIATPLPEAADGTLAELSGLTPHWTPGHSPGHVAYYHRQDDVLLAGDLFTSRRGQLRPPMAMFTSDMQTAVRSGIGAVRQLAPARLEVSHGGPVFDPAAQLDAYAAATKAS